MRLSHFLLVGLLMAQQAHADVVQVPSLSDGTVDLEKVFDGFELAFPVYARGGLSTEFGGKFLGEDFSGRVIEGDTTQYFVLAIVAPTLSEHGHFLIAVLATEAICLRNGLATGLVLWHETKNRDGTAWEVSTSCSNPSN